MGPSISVLSYPIIGIAGVKADPVALFTHVVGNMSDRGIAYARMIEPRATSAGGGDAILEAAPFTSEIFRPRFDGVFISAGGYDREGALEAVASGRADAIAFGRVFIASPDLPERLQQDAPLNPYDRSTFSGGGCQGLHRLSSPGLTAACG
jgi:N-ethylmaleimide reductase